MLGRREERSPLARPAAQPDLRDLASDHFGAGRHGGVAGPVHRKGSAGALGASAPRILRRHILPNAVAPVIVYATIALGQLIAAEATLSFLGIGLQEPAISWGIMISDALQVIRQSPHVLLFPAAFLSVTVLAFIMLGDAVRDALDPSSARE